jgi:hypothetical protein
MVNCAIAVLCGVQAIFFMEPLDTFFVLGHKWKKVGKKYKKVVNCAKTIYKKSQPQPGHQGQADAAAGIP